MDGLLEISIRGEMYLFFNDFTIDQASEIGKFVKTFFTQNCNESDEQLIDEFSHEISQKLGIHLRRLKITKVIAI